MKRWAFHYLFKQKDGYYKLTEIEVVEQDISFWLKRSDSYLVTLTYKIKTLHCVLSMMNALGSRHFFFLCFAMYLTMIILFEY